MKCSVVQGQKVKQFISTGLYTATHYRVKGGGTTEYAITAVHTITPVPSGSKVIHKVEHNGTLRPLEQVHLLLETEVDGPVEYQIKLTEGEAEVLAEVLRHTRGGDLPHKDVEAVCYTLWSELPKHSVSNATVVTGLLRVSKSA